MNINFKSATLKFSISGMRGLFPEDIHAGNIAGVLLAFHSSLKKGPVALARDNRPTGPAMEKIVAGVLQSLGRDVYILGIVPTPSIKAYVKKNKLAGGIMISASHNPVHYTALKFIKEQGYFFEKKENDLLMSHMKKKDISNHSWGSYKVQGKLFEAEVDCINMHIEEVLQKVFPSGKVPRSNIKVALDTLGACATNIAPRLLEKMGIKYVSLFPEIHNDFPRPPEPVAASLAKLGKLVLAEKCDIGFAFDPDADRLAIVGADGKAIGEELTLPLAMMEALKRKPGNVVVNLSSSLYNEFAAEKNKSKVFRSSVGEANVVSMMNKKKAVFGGEGNGGVIDPDISSYGRDSIAGMGWILANMISSGSSIKQMVAKFPSYYMKKEAIKGDAGKVKVMAGLVRKAFPQWKMDTSDGYHFLSPQKEGWIHIRPSNTEPVVRILAEAADKGLLKKLLDTVRS